MLSFLRLYCILVVKNTDTPLSPDPQEDERDNDQPGNILRFEGVGSQVHSRDDRKRD